MCPGGFSAHCKRLFPPAVEGARFVALQQKCHQAVTFCILLYKQIDSIRPPRLIVAKASTKTRRNHRPLRNAAAQKIKQCNFHENIAPWLRKGALATVVCGPAVGQRTFQRLFDISLIIRVTMPFYSFTTVDH